MKAKEFELYDKQGRRKFLSASERRAFLDAAHSVDAHERSLCLFLTYTGCHVTEALDVTAADIDIAGEAVILGEKTGHGRGVPVPPAVIQFLDIVHGVKRSQKMKDGGKGAKLWPADRSTAWRWVSRVMKKAGIEGPQATPRGLRHGFAVEAMKAGIPAETVQQWMGYKELDSVEIYASVVLKEGRSVIAAMWEDDRY